jgi:cysteinyl-tRNA synthetase
MVRETLGDSIDIHLGGADLIFPHHENEIAQSEAATGRELARYWLHNGMVNVEGTKMSKSLGNFTTIRALLDSGVAPMTLRLLVLQAHYRKPLDFTADALAAAASGWKGLNAALSLGSTLHWPVAAADGVDPDGVDPNGVAPDLADSRDRFVAAMDDDLNTAAALAVLFDLARPLRALARRLERGGPDAASEGDGLQPRWRQLHELAGLLGLEAEAAADATPDADLEQAVRPRIEERRLAKAERRYAEADAIRDDLRRQGIELIDRPGGLTDWVRA